MSLVLNSIFYTPAFALEPDTDTCKLVSITPPAVIPPELGYLPKNTEFEYTIHVTEAGTYKAYLRRAIFLGLGEIGFDNLAPDSSGSIKFKNTPGADGTTNVYSEGLHKIEVVRKDASGYTCIIEYEISKQEGIKNVGCNLFIDPATPNPQTPVTYSGTIEPDGLYRFKLPLLVVKLDKEKGYYPKDGFKPDASHQISQNLGKINEGTYPVILQRRLSELITDQSGGKSYHDVWKDIPSSSCRIKNLRVITTVKNPHPSTGPVPVGFGTSSITTPVIPATASGVELPGCTDNADRPAIGTAVGCIRTNPADFIIDLLRFIIGISGGLAFLMMLLGAFQMLTSAGNPETLQAGRERLTSAIIGLLFVIFAVLLLRIIGVDILGLGEQFGFK